MSAAGGPLNKTPTVGCIKPIIRPQVVELDEIHPVALSVSHQER